MEKLNQNKVHSPEEIQDLKKSRAYSDAQLINESGATVSKSGEIIPKITNEQVEKIRATEDRDGALAAIEKDPSNYLNIIPELKTDKELAWKAATSAIKILYDLQRRIESGWATPRERQMPAQIRYDEDKYSKITPNYLAVIKVALGNLDNFVIENLDSDQ